MDHPTDQNIFALAPALSDRELLMVFALRQGTKTQVQVCRDLHCSPRTARRIAASLREKGLLMCSRGDYSLVFPWTDTIATFGVGHGERTHPDHEVNEPLEGSDHTLSDDAGAHAEDVPNDETSPSAPVGASGGVDLTDNNADGWYELEQQWVQHVPGVADVCSQEAVIPKVVEEATAKGSPPSPNEQPPLSTQAQTKNLDPALEQIAAALESGEGEWTRLERWAKRSGVIVHTLSDNKRTIDRQKLFALVQSLHQLNDILKGPVRPEYTWFAEAFHRTCRENSYDAPVPDCTDGFEVNLLLDHLFTKGVYAGGGHYPQDVASITKKLEFLVENWAEVCAHAREYGFVQGRPDSPSFDWVVRYGESVFNCVHHKMRAIAELRLNEIFQSAGTPPR
jgi:hypothetical protein